MKNNEQLLTIRKLAKQFNLSRSTLLYYDSIGLLSPSKRSDKNYRLYSEKDRIKLEKISMYSGMGVPLKEIDKLISSDGKSAAGILENQLRQIGEKINELRKQQHSIVNVLQNKKVLKNSGLISREDWVEVLRQSGLDKKGRHLWHFEFEKNSPAAHNDFLISLGIPDNEIKKIRKWSLKFM